MATSFISTNTIGAGAQFAFTASGNALVVLPNVTLGSTTSATIGIGAFTDLEISVLGTLISSVIQILPTNSSFTVAAGASFLNFEPTSGNAGLFLNGANSLAQIDGTLSSKESIAILASGGGNTVNVTGTVSGASGAFLGLSGSVGDILVNSGDILASAVDDANNDTRFNNAVFVEGASTRVTNLAGGQLTATASQANGVRINAGGEGSIVINHGAVTSVNATGVEFGAITAEQVLTLVNTGVIQGRNGAFSGSAALGNLSVTNSGRMIGNVKMGFGNDLFDARGGRLDGTWSGNDGNDRYDGRGASLITGQVLGGTGNDTILGGDGAESISGEADLDTIRGGGGDDTIFGGTGADVLSGDDGHDELFGGDEVDDLSGGAGNDLLDGGDGGLIAKGGDGDDGFIVDGGVTAFFINAYGGAGNDAFFGGEIRDNIFGGSGDDDIFSGQGDDSVVAGAGDDLIDGFEGADTIKGGAGDDDIRNFLGDAVLFGGQGFDTISAGDGDDQLDGGGDGDLLDGGKGRDTIIGGTGDDTVIGGGSRDVMSGGTGADVFVMALANDSGTTAATRDVITDFQSGIDDLDLSLIDANTLVAGNQAFVYIGTAAFTGTAGQLKYVAATGLLSGDINGDSVQDFVIEFQNLTALTAGDFIL